MPKPQAATELDPDTEDREAEVGDPDGSDETFDEQDDLNEEGEDQAEREDEEADEDAEPDAPEDERFAQVNAQIAQLTQAVNGLVQATRRRGSAPAAQPPSPAKDFDEMTGRELAAHFSKHSNNQMNQMVQQVAGVLQRQQEAMFLLRDSKSDPRVVQEALALSYRQPNLPLAEAYKMAQGMAAQGQLGRYQKQVDSDKRQRRKRSRKARLGSTRPSNAPAQRRPKVDDVRSAMASAMDELAAQGVDIAD